MNGRWQFGVDRGGTFTDVVAQAPDGTLHTAKLLSEDPGRYDDAAVEAIRRLTGVATGPLPPFDLRIGTTIATNALLERKGEPVLLAITQGFGDALVIGTQDRPDIFARDIRRPAPLHADVVEIDERVTHEGEVLRPLDHGRARQTLSAAFARGLRAVAIVLMHGYRHPAHELALAEIAKEIGFEEVVVGHRAGALIKLIGRGDTAVVDAYLSPILRRYVDELEAALGADAAPLFMQSSGGLTLGRTFRGKDAILSGPAGGIVGMAQTAMAAGFDRVIGFDMGGTSTDVSLFAGKYERDNEGQVAGVRIRAPMLRIHTVAAGGGSICGFDGGRLFVGPASAGAVPGPACYRRGGPLTVTDCNVALGKIQPDQFPAVFGANGDQPLDAEASRARLTELAVQVGRTPEETAEGLIDIAVADMANAIRAVSVARGHDVQRFVLACFGGAGGQHACLVADALGIDRVLVHPLAGVLSAYGMGLAERSVVRERTLASPVTDGDALAEAADALMADARAALTAQGVAESRTVLSAHLRTAGADSPIEVPFGNEAAMREAFGTAFRARFGYRASGPLMVDMLRAEAIADSTGGRISLPAPPVESAPPLARAQIWTAGERHEVPVFARAALAAGARVEGPALIIDDTSTTMVEPGWRATIDGEGSIVLDRASARAASRIGTAYDPVRLEIFAGLFMSIAEEMGGALRHSASSVNIRERLDFSCALFDADGNLVANAPHIPVHLGSMGESIRTVLRRRSNDGRGIRRGDVYALNAPYDGGTHLPDITVIQPVFAGDGDRPDFFVAARGHHADVGGTTPGSMPPDSRTIDEEGTVFDNVLLVENGVFREQAVSDLLRAGPYPARNVAMNLADLAAQIAACARGAEGLHRAAGEHGLDTVRAYMGHVQDYAEQAVRRLIPTLSGGDFAYELDSGAVVRVAVRVAGDAIAIDFTGTSEQQPSNFNAPLAVVRAAVLYVLRTLIDVAVPLNDGFLRAVTLTVPEGSMLNPRHPAAVVAGNVEVSQVVTDTLLGALGAMAASQGTMNNLTFGDDTLQYYETIAGGSGAGPGFDGTSAVQTHMTNSRLTDPEVLESRFPVLLEEFSIRRGSGGAGAHRGGDGAVRRLRFLAPMRAAILSNRRRVAPFGLAGGQASAPGLNRIERANGRVDPLGSTDATDMAAGDVLVIETPGGGGFGPVAS
ncbi:hydantoinase B/oxoprolinase family protein [Sphingomonas sp. IW22]|uniref:hydantoinase B/oxoprolinase family protein n=1 Tax=Sphingomonas sp. IW22 TaxID=3242489 RepID=UPI003520D93E